MKIRKLKISNFQAKSVAVFLTALYFLIAPFEDLLTTSLGSFGKFVIIPIMGILLIPTIKQKKVLFSKDIWRFSGLVLYLIFLAWVSVIWASDTATAIARNSAYTTLPLVFVVYSMHFYSENEYQLIRKAALLGGLAAIIYILVTQGIQYVLSGRMTLVNTNDPNNLAAAFLLPIGYAFDIMINAKGARKLLYVLLFGVLTYFTLLTGSRGGLLSIVVLLLAYCIVGGYFKKSRHIVGLALILSAAVFLVLYLLPKDMFLRYFSYDSFLEATQNNQQRGVIWKHVILDVIPNMKPWGYGSGCAFSTLYEYYGYDKGIHNTYLCMILEYGVLGIPCFILLLVRLAKKLKERGNTIEFALLLGIMCTIFFLDAYPKKFFWNILYLIVIKLQLKESEAVQL